MSDDYISQADTKKDCPTSIFLKISLLQRQANEVIFSHENLKYMY